MAFTQRATWEPLREVAFGSITGTFAAFGAALSHSVVSIGIFSTLDKDVYISDDGTNNKLRIPANGFQLWDISTNSVAPSDEKIQLPANRQIYLKYVSAPGSGNIWMSALYAEAR